MKQKKIILYLTLLLVGLFFRLYQLRQNSVYPDEITWMVKGKESFYALTKFNLDYFRHAWWNDTAETYAIGWPLVLLNGTTHVLLAGESKFSLHLFSDIVASRLPLALIGSFTAVVIFWFAQKRLKTSIAFFVALAYTLSPITIALDRWIIHDSFLTLFSFLSLAIYLTAFESKKNSFLPGIFLSLAFLTKPHGVLPALSWFILLLFDRRSLKLFIANTLSFLITTLIVWPQSWFSPLISIPEYFYRQFTLASTGRPIPNYFFGPTKNPHWSYFIFQLLFRTPEIILGLAVVGLIYLNKKSSVFLAALSFLFIFFLSISIVATKGGIRYALPILPWVYLSAGYGLKRISSRLFQIILLIPIIALPFIYHPDYYLYYNYLIGGPKNAQKYDLVGLCLGSKSALEYLDKNKIDGLTGIIGCYDTGPYHSARPQTKNWSAADILILEQAYAQQYPHRSEVEALKNKQLIHTIYEHGVLTARIYH